LEVAFILWDVGIVRPEALIPKCRQADDRPLPAGSGKDWAQAHIDGVLRDALALSDSAGCLAYWVCDNHRAFYTASEYA